MDQESIERRVTVADKFAAFGTLVGLVGGYFLGEQVNDYVPFLKEAPALMQYGTDVATMYLSAKGFGGVMASVGDLVGRVVNVWDNYSRY